MWGIGLALALACGWGWWFLAGRAPSAERLAAVLPEGDGPTLYLDVSLMRRAGLVEKLAGQAGAEEEEYRRFVEATGFDYRRDLDAVLVRFGESDMLVAAAGRYEWEKLKAYTLAQGGRCAGTLCSGQGSAADRQVSWMHAGRGVLAVAVSADPMKAAVMGGGAGRLGFQAPRAALWLHVPGSELKARPGLPPGLSAFLSALEGAQRAMLSVERRGADYAVALDAPCEDAARAGAIAGRLKEQTEMIGKLLAREGKKPEAGELTGVLAGGRFRAEASVVRGEWPVAAAFAEKLGK